MIVFLFSLLLLLNHTTQIIIDPINKTCIAETEYTYDYIEKWGIVGYTFKLPPFSESTVEIDLRHLMEIPVDSDNNSYFSLNMELIQNEVSVIEEGIGISPSVNSYSVFVDKETSLILYFEIEDKYDAYKYLLMGSVSFSTEKQNERIPTEFSSFLFVVSSYDVIMVINRKLIYLSIGLQYPVTMAILLLIFLRPEWAMIQNKHKLQITFNSIALPYIPYISNCQNEGKKIYLSMVMEDDESCDLKSVDDTVPINEFRFGTSATADYCKIERECVYDEKPAISTEFPYWLNLPSEKTLFYITREKINYEEYEIGMRFDETELVKCKIEDSKGDNSSSLYPLNVKLTLDYYQVTKETKRMISCSVEFSLYMESSVNFTYQLEVETKPLNHTYIMLAFGFQWYIYMIVFVIIGIISNIENLVLFIFHSCVSKKEDKSIKLRPYIKIFFNLEKGTLLAILLWSVLFFSITIMMNAKIFQTTLYNNDLPTETPRVFWDRINSEYISNYESNLALKYRSGRMGLSFFVVGIVIMFYSSKFFIGCEKVSKQYKDYEIMGRLLKPKEWNRGKFLFGSFVFISIDMFLIYFAYSNVYSQNMWLIMVMTKVCMIVMEEAIVYIYEDLLPCLPLKFITEIITFINTLSASNFYDYLFSFLIDVAINMIEKIYVSQLTNLLIDEIEDKVEEFSRFYANLMNDTEEKARETGIQQVDEDEEENQFILMNGVADEVKFFENEEIENYNEDNTIDLDFESVQNLQHNISQKFLAFRKFESKVYSETHNISEVEGEKDSNKDEKEIFQKRNSNLLGMLIDNISSIFTGSLQPFVVLIFWITYDESKVLDNYGISYNNVIFYLLSSLVITAFTCVNVVIILHVLEVYADLNFEVLITKYIQRFEDRNVFWKAKDEDINKGLETKVRGVDHYCFSWQFYFIMGIYVLGMVSIILGINVMINNGYHPFKDLGAVLIMFFWAFIAISSIWLLQTIAFKLNVDGWKDYEANSNNPNAILDFDLKDDAMRRQSFSDEVTNQPLIINENSEQELIGNNALPRKSKKIFSKISKDEIKSLGFEDSFLENSDGENDSEMSEETLNIKVSTICKKLEVNFEDPKFCEEYFRKNKEFLKENLERILPLMKELPEINEYKIPPTSSSLSEPNAKRENKNYDLSVIEIMSKWKIKTDDMLRQRQNRGRELEKGLSTCSFCFETWGIYYGHGGICLKCSHELNLMKKNI